MPRSGYSDVNWFVRAARAAPVIAGAALLGGMIGGFAMFAIDSALTWQPVPEPVSQPGPETRADNAASAGIVQTNKPVRIVGGAIPDPSAGMSGPPPAQQQQQQQQKQSSAAITAQSQISSQLLTPKPLGPALQLQPQTATAAPNSSAQQTQNQATQNQTANQAPVSAQNMSGARQQPTRWPDALSRAHQNAANATSAQQQGTPSPAPAPANEHAMTKNSEPDGKEANSDRGTAADDQDRGNSSRHGRHSRRHSIVGNNALRNGEDSDASAASSRRQDARGYDRLYDSYGNRRNRSYSSSRERPYGDSRADQDEPRSEPFWGGGFFRRGYQDDD